MSALPETHELFGAELVEHLERTLIQALLLQTEHTQEQEAERLAAAGRPEMAQLYWHKVRTEAGQLAHAEGLTLLPGPPHRWVIDDVAVYCWPTGRRS